MKRSLLFFVICPILLGIADLSYATSTDIVINIVNRSSNAYVTDPKIVCGNWTVQTGTQRKLEPGGEQTFKITINPPNTQMCLLPYVGKYSFPIQVGNNPTIYVKCKPPCAVEQQQNNTYQLAIES